MKKRSRILVLILTAMLSTEPVQIVYAETAEATHVTSESTSQLDPKPRKMQITLTVVPARKLIPGWVAVEKGISMAAGRWYFTSEIGLGNDQRQEILSPVRVEFAIQAGRYISNKKRYYLSNGDAGLETDG